MGIFGKSDEDKEREDIARQNEARHKMEEALAHRAAAAHPAPAPTPTAAPVPVPASGGAVTPPAAPAAHDEPETYVVAKGDSLSKIAKHHLGNANEWRRIYEANRAVIGDDPDKIFPGQKLRIPKA